MNRSKRSVLRAVSRDPIAARTQLPIPPRDLHRVGGLGVFEPALKDFSSKAPRLEDSKEPFACGRAAALAARQSRGPKGMRMRGSKRRTL